MTRNLKQASKAVRSTQSTLATKVKLPRQLFRIRTAINDSHARVDVICALTKRPVASVFTWCNLQAAKAKAGYFAEALSDVLRDGCVFIKPLGESCQTIGALQPPWDDIFDRFKINANGSMVASGKSLAFGGGQ